MHITALPVAVPLIAAAVLVGVRHYTPRLFDDLASQAALVIDTSAWSASSPGNERQATSTG